MTQGSKSWYERMGVEPPEHHPHLTEEEIAQKFEEIRLSAKHDWRQEGARLICVGCKFQHATEPIFVDYLLKGTDKSGNPIMEKLDLTK